MLKMFTIIVHLLHFCLRLPREHKVVVEPLILLQMPLHGGGQVGGKHSHSYQLFPLSKDFEVTVVFVRGKLTF